MAERRAASEGIYCGEDGVWLGPAALIERSGAGGCRVRSGDQIETLLRAAYGDPPDAAGCVTGLHRVAAHLCEGNLPLAMIAAVRLRLGAIAEDRIKRLARTDDLLKANFNPDEPRDDRGRWTDDVEGDFILDDPADEGSGSSGGEQTPTAAGGSGPAVARVWEHYPNADFRNRLAIAEGSANHQNFGYSEVNNASNPNLIALGRYQLTPVALRAAGMMDRAGRWTGKLGVHSVAAFLSDREAQEKALTDYLTDNIRQLRANGAFAHIGQTIDGLRARFPVTLAGMLAAAHREGAVATRDYLNRIAENGFTSKGLGLSRQERAIKTRLRTFSDASYE
ncbi:MAG: hypothetical protein ACREET_05980 [Stellaceae bacterium]